MMASMVLTSASTSGDFASTRSEISPPTAEAESLGLHVRDAGRDPHRARGMKIVIGRLGKEGIDGGLSRAMSSESP